MSLISKLPTWAQAPVQRLSDRQPLPGTEQSPLPEEGLGKAGEGAAAIAFISSFDEVEGSDEAMGQPGVVVNNGNTLHFTGNFETGQGEAVLTAQTEQAEVAVYMEAGQDGLEIFTLGKVGEAVMVEGAVAVPQPNGELEGYLISGQVA